ncbi:MAG: lysozyme [Lamprobacter sp.]|uniref:lysozyme n=1 Tax=Lamprobacter sp. TaxID=3100796 RepID=UPI002B26286A|nr:lysozyme [Lamprobacter sp.]MEA3641301.1 lysozyme [Lamprobacter sp.]
MIEPTRISQTGIDLIKRFEGLELQAYRDPVGIVTVGYGHTKTARMGQQISEAEAESLLRQDLEQFERCVSESVKAPLEQSHFDALVSFAFNVGCGALKRSTLLKKLNALDYPGAADELPRWNQAGGRVLRGLVRRRAAERDLFLSA